MAANTVAQLNGNYKRVYGGLHNAIPKTGWLLENIPWDKGHKVGDSFHEMIVLTNENGITYGGSAGSAFTLVAPSAMGTAPAYVTPFEYVARPQISYGAASRAASAGPRAFTKAIGMVVTNAMESLARRLEIACLYGQSASGIGRVAVGAIVDNDSTSFYLVFAEAEWAPRIWAGAEGAVIEAYDEGDALETTGGSGDMTITSVDFRNRRIKVSAASALITQIETKNDTEYLNIYFKGSRSNDMVGMDVITQNLTGTVHGISATTYGGWAGNLFDVGSVALTHAHIQGYAAELQARGLEDEDLILLCNPKTYSDLHQDQASARVYDESYKGSKAEAGHREIAYHTGSGWVRVVASGFVKGGEAFMFPKSCWKRIGSEDREWELPGGEADPWTPVADTAAAEMRIYADQTVFCHSPALCAKIDGIANTFGTTG